MKKKFLAVYLGSEAGEGWKRWNAMDEKTREAKETEGFLAWKAWAAKNASSIVGDGGPLGTTKRVDPKGVSDVRNQMAAFTVVEAESHDAAAHLFVDHPHFTIFPGDAVEIMEILPIPSM